MSDRATLRALVAQAIDDAPWSSEARADAALAALARNPHHVMSSLEGASRDISKAKASLEQMRDALEHQMARADRAERALALADRELAHARVEVESLRATVRLAEYNQRDLEQLAGLADVVRDAKGDPS